MTSVSSITICGINYYTLRNTLNYECIICDLIKALTTQIDFYLDHNNLIFGIDKAFLEYINTCVSAYSMNHSYSNCFVRLHYYDNQTLDKHSQIPLYNHYSPFVLYYE